PCLHGPRGAAADDGGDRAPHRHQTRADPRREGSRLYGGRLRPRLRQAGHLHGPARGRPQSRGGPARCVPRPFAGAGVHRRSRSERPVIIAGGGVRASGAAAELVKLAEALAIPVATSLNGKDVIPGDHPLSVGVVGTYSRESANLAVAQASFVCFVGTTAGGMTTNLWSCPKIGVRAVQIDIDPEALGRNYPLE